MTDDSPGLGAGHELDDVAAGQAGARAEAEGSSAGAAKWAAMKELERAYPGITVDHVRFEVIEERDAEEGGPLTRVAGVADLEAWRAAERDFEWPAEPVERVRHLLGELLGLDLLELGSQTVTRGVPMHPELSASAPSATVDEPEKLESLRFLVPTLLSVLCGVPPEFQQARLVRV